MSTHGWKITNRQEQRTGTYYALNTSPVVTVKARTLPLGPGFLCLTCLKSDCPHCLFVAEQDTPDTEAA